MSHTRELILIRHGESTANATGVWQGQMDFPLSDRGRRQAACAGVALRSESVHGVYASPLARAFETAQIVAREGRFGVEARPLDGLKERRGGILEGTTRAQRVAENPDLMQKLQSLPEEEGWPLVGAETDEEVLGRFEAAISDAMYGHEGGQRVVVVSHGGAMRAFLRDRFGTSVLPGTLRARNASITRLLWGMDEGDERLLLLADVEHLPEELRGPRA